jgi:hypothetical protein
MPLLETPAEALAYAESLRPAMDSTLEASA